MVFRNILDMQMYERDLYNALDVGQQLDRGQVHSSSKVGQQPNPPQIHTSSILESRHPDFSLFDTYQRSKTALPQPEIFDASQEKPSNGEGDNHTSRAGKDRSPCKRAFWILIALGIVT